MATTINSGDEKKFISLANLKNFKIKADDNYIKASARAAKNGVASLDENGRIPITQLGNIDTTFVEVKDVLPETNIGKHLYLIPDTGAKGVKQNKYSEYIYTGALPIEVTNKETGATNYDENYWEKLGDFQAEIDLSGYLTTASAASTYLGKSEGVTKVDINSTNLSYTVNNKPIPVTIPVATKNTSGPTGAKGHNGFMTAEQATALDNATSNITTINGTLSGKADNSTVNSLKSTVDALSTTVGNHTDSIGSINTTLGSKVDKVTGKGLSTNDFSNDYKKAVDSHTTSITNLNNNKLDKTEFNSLKDIAVTAREFNGVKKDIVVDNTQSVLKPEGIYYYANDAYFVALKTNKYYSRWDNGGDYNDYSNNTIKPISRYYYNVGNASLLIYEGVGYSTITNSDLCNLSFTADKTTVKLNYPQIVSDLGDEDTFDFPMASDSQAGAITSAQFNAFTAATKAVTTKTNGLMLSDDKNKLDRLSDLKHITISQLDKCGYTTEGDLVKDVAKYGELKFYVTDAAAVVTCTTDASRHAIFQTITTHNVLDISSTGVVTLSNTTHKDGILFTYQRYFAFSGGTYATANLNKWTYWYVLDINGYAPTALPTDSAVYKANYTSVFKDIAATTDSTKKVSLNSIRISKDGTLATNTLLESASEQEIKDIFK